MLLERGKKSSLNFLPSLYLLFFSTLKQMKKQRKINKEREREKGRGRGGEGWKVRRKEGRKKGTLHFIQSQPEAYSPCNNYFHLITEDPADSYSLMKLPISLTVFSIIQLVFPES